MSDVDTPPAPVPAKKPKARHVEPLLDLEEGEWSDKIEFNFPPFSVIRDHSGRIIVGGGGGRGRTGVPNKLIIVEVEALEQVKFSQAKANALASASADKHKTANTPIKSSKDDKSARAKPGQPTTRLPASQLSGNVLMRTVCRFDTGQEAVMNMALHPTENLLAVGVEERCRVYNIGYRGFEPLAEVVTDFAEQEEERGQKRVRFDPRGKWIATCGGDGWVRIFAFPSLALLKAIPAHSTYSEKECVDLSCTSTILAVTSRERCLVYDIRTGKELACLSTSGRTLSFRDARFCPITPPASASTRRSANARPSDSTRNKRRRRVLSSRPSSSVGSNGDSPQGIDNDDGDDGYDEQYGDPNALEDADSGEIDHQLVEESSGDIWDSEGEMISGYDISDVFLAGVMPKMDTEMKPGGKKPNQSADSPSSKTSTAPSASNPSYHGSPELSQSISSSSDKSGERSMSASPSSSRSSSSPSSASFIPCDTRFLYTTEFQPQKQSVIRKWDVRTWKCVKSTTLRWTGDHHTAFSISSDGHSIALGSVEGQVRIFKASNLAEVKRWKDKHEFFVTDFAFALPPNNQDDDNRHQDTGIARGYGIDHNRIDFYDLNDGGVDDNGSGGLVNGGDENFETNSVLQANDSNSTTSSPSSSFSSSLLQSTLSSLSSMSETSPSGSGGTSLRSSLLSPSKSKSASSSSPSSSSIAPSPHTFPSHLPILFSTSGDNTLKATVFPHIRPKPGFFSRICCCCKGNASVRSRSSSKSTCFSVLKSLLFGFFLIGLILLITASIIIYIHANHSVQTRMAWQRLGELASEVSGDSSWSSFALEASHQIHELSHSMQLSSMHMLREVKTWIQKRSIIP